MENQLVPNVFIKNYWNYFLDLEKQFLVTKQFVDFDVANYSAFSLEYLKLMQTVCSEIDVLAKVIAKYHASNFEKYKNVNIQKWGFIIQQAYPCIENECIIFNQDNEIKPWTNWRYEKYTNVKQNVSYKLLVGKQTPKWWSAYNKIKHERTSISINGKLNYSRANLGNLVQSFSALYILEVLFLGELIKSSNNISFTYDRSALFDFKK